MKRFLQAKGRLKVGEMNRTEAAYRDYLEQQKNAGLILKYWFSYAHGRALCDHAPVVTFAPGARRPIDCIQILND